ncbi:MAG: nucleotide pyrophosphohydrolase [Candidatus Pacebacteria bacterium]|nr:nucleotide pyrophosphohydrolase [Candidatus Paceibacterota bacterium]
MKKLEKEIATYLKERGWNTMTPSDMAKSISIEAAELLEVFQWDNKSLADTKTNPARMKKIKEELADVFIYCLDMAVLLDIDSETIIREKLEYNKKKYPAIEMKHSKGHERYHEIKKQYRNEKRS